MANLIKVNIDGRDIEVKPGTLIIEAAKRLGIEIPTFCYDDRLKSVGACRMCLVEVAMSPKLVASCATPVAPNMVVKTNSEKVIKARTGVLEFLLINHPLDCPTCDKGGECPLQNLTVKYGPPISRYQEDKIRFIDDPAMKFDDVRLGPEIWMNKNRCIICFKCVRIARDLAGGDDLGIFQRGAMAKVDIPAEMMYANEFSGNTVENCPVGALMSDSFRYKIRTWLLEKQDSLSWVCPDGANMIVEHNQGKIWRHSSRRNDNVDMGFLSDKDRYSFDIASHPDRILRPLGNNNGSLHVIGYDDAIARMVHRVNEEKPANWGLLLDTTLTNEEAYCASEYFRSKFPSSSVAVASELELDNNIPATALGLKTPMQELEESDLFIIAGCDLAAEHPLVGLRVKKALRQGASVYFIGQRKMSLGQFEVKNIICRPGSDAETAGKLLALKNGNGNVELPDDLKVKLKTDLKHANNIQILAGYDFLSSPVRGAYFQLLNELSNSLNARLSILTTETNYLGVNLSGRPDTSFRQLVEKIENGQIKTLLVAGGDPVNVYPDRNRIINAFKKLDFLIYWGALNNATAELATLIFPALLPTENSGSYLNIERRLQFMKKPYRYPQHVTSLIELLTEIKSEIDADLLYYSAAEVFARMAGEIAEFRNLSFEKSEGTVIASTDLSVIKSNDSQVNNPQQFPFVLTFARSAYYGASGATEKSGTLKKLTPAQKILMHPDIGKQGGYEKGQRVMLETDVGIKGDFELELCSSVERNTLVLFGYSDANPPNKFMAGYNRPVYAKVSKA